MAHFARINSASVVEQVVFVNNSVLQDENGKESEALGVAFCQSLFGADTNWVQTSYNRTIRGNFAGVGIIYDKENDVFLEPQPYPSWVINPSTLQWEAPVPMPTCAEDYYYGEGTGTQYVWDEEKRDWIVPACYVS